MLPGRNQFNTMVQIHRGISKPFTLKQISEAVADALATANAAAPRRRKPPTH